MESLNVYASRLVTKREYFAPGHRACQGCAEALAVRLVAKALGQNVVVASATGCMEIVSTPFPFTNWRVPWIHVAFENAAAVATGAEGAYRALVRKGALPEKGTVFLGMGGDGATSDIGLQALSGAFERGHRFIYVCYDNEAYMNTGTQRSGSTPHGAKTTTTWTGKRENPKDVLAIMEAHRIGYVASTSAAFPTDVYDKVLAARDRRGLRYIHMSTPCPSGWSFDPKDSVRLGKLAVETGLVVLFEIADGVFRLTGRSAALAKSGKPRTPVAEYLASQGRFRGMSEADVAEVQAWIDERWGRYVARNAGD